MFVFNKVPSMTDLFGEQGLKLGALFPLLATSLKNQENGLTLYN